MTTQAYIADGARVNQSTAGGAPQTIAINAEDDTKIVNVSGALALSEGSAGVAVSIIVEVIDRDVNAYIGKSARVSAGGDMTIQAKSKEELFELVVAGGASESAGVAGSILVLALNKAGSHSTSAYVDDYAVVHAGGKLEISASDVADKLNLASGNVAIGGGSAGVGASVVVVVRDGVVDAAVHQHADVQANGGSGLRARAAQTE